MDLVSGKRSRPSSLSDRLFALFAFSTHSSGPLLWFGMARKESLKDSHCLLHSCGDLVLILLNLKFCLFDTGCFRPASGILEAEQM